MTPPEGLATFAPTSTTSVIADAQPPRHPPRRGAPARLADPAQVLPRFSAPRSWNG